MSGRQKGWDLTTKHSLDAAAEWVRGKSGALLVLVVRGEDHGNDLSFAVDAAVSPGSAVAMVESVLPELGEQLAAERNAKRAEANAKLRERVYRENLRAAGGAGMMQPLAVRTNAIAGEGPKRGVR